MNTPARWQIKNNRPENRAVRVAATPSSPLLRFSGLEWLPKHISEKKPKTPHPAYGHPLPIGWGEGQGEGLFGNLLWQTI